MTGYDWMKIGKRDFLKVMEERFEGKIEYSTILSRKEDDWFAGIDDEIDMTGRGWTEIKARNDLFKNL